LRVLYKPNLWDGENTREPVASRGPPRPRWWWCRGAPAPCLGGPRQRSTYTRRFSWAMIS